MFITTFPVGAFQCNCTILADKKSGEAIIVDPGDEGDKIVALVRQHGFAVKYLVHTHAHVDHIAATKAVHDACGGTVCLHAGDQPLYDNIQMQADFLGLQIDTALTPVTQNIVHGDVIEAASLRLDVLHTPGHTPGSVCFYLDQGKIMFTGDTLFMNSIGRTDLWGGDTAQIMASLKERVMTAPLETTVVCGHGPQTTIAQERARNPFLRGM